MAGCVLGKTLAAVSLSVALASLTVRASACRSIPACRNSLSSCGFHFNSSIMSTSEGAKEESHSKALTSPYPGSKVQRSQVPNEKVGWLVEWQDYSPVEYTAASVLAGPRWADPQISESNFSPKFNEKDGPVERKSQNGLYEIENGRPRWKRDRCGNKVPHRISGKNILQFVAIKRKDCGEWAIPGGMVDPGEKISDTLKREFGEEALNSLQKSSTEKRELEEQLYRLFSQEHLVIYKGYVDDPRNTDNAWIETEAVNYHDETGEVMDKLTLEAGDDAGKVKWVDISDELKLYASHSQFIKLVAEKRDAHWSENSKTDCHGL
ncbi:ADP-ribose pyrophosphatase, mitochondrial isoform X2 [Manis pentadactyla]|uniref:ADP-ribose pyrophosphatase, mitochondrial isoform X2 n=1 Tax=Manis pentadactyla TaxID=143292 RepID=UPI00255C5018|nr:ADP-ribose pyrophosphatase, mitochondrial isoform X2 [Manis pentadactyla]